jgi:two-component system response regulator YesN
MGISKMLRAYNGDVAKEIIMAEKPELIICDIGMPKSSGIDVLKFVHDNNIETEFSFLTCYESFEYAQTAMRYGAVNYMTKPIDMDELTSVITKMIRDSKERKANASKLEDANLINALTNNLLRQVRDGHFGINRERLDRALQKVNVGFSADSQWRLVYVTADSSMAISNGWENELLTEGFQRLTEEVLVNNVGTAYTVTDLGEKFINLTCFVPAEQVSENELLLRCRKLIELCETTFSLIPVCLVSDPIELYKAFEDTPALNRRITRLRHHAGRVYLFREPGNASDEDYYLDHELLLRCIRQGRKADYIEAITGALNKIVRGRDSNINIILRLQQELLQIFYGCLRDNGISTQILLGDDIINKFDILSQWSLSDFMEFAQSIYDYVISILHEANGKEDVIANAIQYLAEHFREDVDRDDVAAVSFISPNYLSKKFRDETGMNLREYINHLRINEAKRLLLSTNMTISEVAGELGYDNSSYFSTVFKKICGVSPVKWREAAEIEEEAI